MTLGADEFLRRFLQHVLPRGFQKVRYYGFASPNARHFAGDPVGLTTQGSGVRGRRARLSSG